MYRGGIGHWTWLAHRISGVAIVYFLTLHIFETLQLRLGPEAYNEATAVYKQPWFRPFEFLLVMAVVYHAFNGIRVTLLDFIPKLNLYPRVIFWCGVVLFAILTPFIGYAMLRPMFDLSLSQIFASADGVGWAALIVGPIVLPTLYLFWRGTGLSEGRKPQLSASKSTVQPTVDQFERWAWIFMRLSGVMLVVLVFVHLYIMHIENDIAAITGEFVIERFKANRVWQLVDLAMSFLAWLHGLNGVRIVLTDYMHTGAKRKVVLYGLGLFGLAWLIVGSWVLFIIPLSS